MTARRPAARIVREVPHDFNKCRCDQWGRCLVHCPSCTCAADACQEPAR